MARRNMTKIVEKTVVNSNYDMTYEEMRELVLVASRWGIKGAYSSIYSAFKYGYAMGQRESKANTNKRKKRKCMNCLLKSPM